MVLDSLNIYFSWFIFAKSCARFVHLSVRCVTFGIPHLYHSTDGIQRSWYRVMYVPYQRKRCRHPLRSNLLLEVWTTFRFGMSTGVVEYRIRQHAKDRAGWREWYDYKARFDSQMTVSLRRWLLHRSVPR